MLTQKRLKELLEYDPKTGLFIWVKVNSNAISIGDIAGSTNDNGYIVISVDNTMHRAHRLAWLFMEGYMPETRIDHKDRIPGNNRWENLRSASHQCNMRNTGNRSTNTSGVKGVCPVRGKWMSQMTIDGVNLYLGIFDDFKEAVCHRLAAEQCVGWSGCDNSSPAYRYVIENVSTK